MQSNVSNAKFSQHIVTAEFSAFAALSCHTIYAVISKQSSHWRHVMTMQGDLAG